MIDSTLIRKDFPILNQPGKPLVYFDNACMSLRPQPVLEAIMNYYTTMSACAGRSNHRLAKSVSDAVDESREKVKKFINASNQNEIIFTRNTSEGLNLLANSLKLDQGDVVVISDKEHNSNLVPWLRLKNEKGIVVRVVRNDSWADSIDTQVKVVSVVYSSNLDGVTNPIKEISRLAHQVGAVIIVDAAQAIPHQPVDVRDLDLDFMAFSAHKMCGPSGMGVLYGKYELLKGLQPFMVGGDTVETSTYDSYTMLPVPEKFEAGLQDYAGIIGTGAAIDYLSRIGLENIHAHEVQLNKYVTEQLAQFERVHIIGPEDPETRGGITAFIVDNADHHQIALMLDRVGNVMVRSGQHCVHSWFNDRKIKGSVRVSLSFYNTIEEIDVFIETLRKILDIV
jgi:cysteine desulfurase/selenocysteine lyase